HRRHDTRGGEGRATKSSPSGRPLNLASWRRASALLVIASSPGRAALRNPRAIRAAVDPRVVAQGFSPARDREQPWKGCATKSAPSDRPLTHASWPRASALLVITSSPGRAALRNPRAIRPAVDPRVVAQGFSPARDHEQPWKGCATKSAPSDRPLTHASWRRASALLVITSSPGRAALRNPRAIRPAVDPHVVAKGFSPARDHEQPWKGCATKSAPSGRPLTHASWRRASALLVIASSPGRAEPCA